VISRELGVRLRGFGDMAAIEIERRTGLTGEALSQAKARESDEPFVPIRPLGPEEEIRLDRLAADLGLRVTKGGRFYHLIGPSSKGAAARLLLTAYSGGGIPVRSLALGDGPNDLELLLAVDRPVVVARPDGTHAPELRAALPAARFTRGIGPVGFSEAVTEYLARPW
jgi:mannosyl-3-phosphoglycerate phosphatase